MSKRKTRSSTKADTLADTGPSEHKIRKIEQSDDDPSTRSESHDHEYSEHYTVPFNDTKQITCHRRSPHNAPSFPPDLIFTHGAGGGIRAPSTSDFATGFSSFASIVCYEGSMNLTNRIRYFHAVIQEHEERAGREQAGNKAAFALGGRSMGARAAVLTALERYGDVGDEDEECNEPRALVLVSYPLMAGGKGEKREPEKREKILTDLPEDVDVLFVVGDSDAQCPLNLLSDVREKMTARSWLCVVEGADHGMNMKPKKASEAMRKKSGEVAAQWLKERCEDRRFGEIRWDDKAEEILFEGWREEVARQAKDAA